MRERGTVRSWNNAEGHGRIQADAGDVLWCHFSFLNMDGFKTLSVGQRVEFTRMTEVPAPLAERPQAWDVTSL